MTIPCL